MEEEEGREAGGDSAALSEEALPVSPRVAFILLLGFLCNQQTSVSMPATVLRGSCLMVYSIVLCGDPPPTTRPPDRRSTSKIWAEATERTMSLSALMTKTGFLGARMCILVVCGH